MEKSGRWRSASSMLLGCDPRHEILASRHKSKQAEPFRPQRSPERCARIYLPCMIFRYFAALSFSYRVPTLTSKPGGILLAAMAAIESAI